MGCNQSTIQRALKQHDYETFVERKQYPGRPRKTTAEDDRHLIITAKRNFDLPFRDITNLSGLNISPKTTARRCKEVELISRYAHRKPFLKAEHKKARLEWANTYKDWTVEDWMRVIFSDECLIRIGVDPQRRRVLRPNGTALQERYLTPTFKSGRVTIMIWACFSGDRMGPLLTLEQGGIGSEEYMEILYEGLLSMVDDILEPPADPETIVVTDQNTFLFMHDNAPCHKTQEVTDLLAENNIPVMKWPAQSPDLNPIENLWRELKSLFHQKFRDLRASPSASKASFETYSELIQECWNEVGAGFIQALMESMPKRCAAVIAAKGGHSSY